MSDVFVLEVLIKNEDTMKTLENYLGENYPDDRPVLSGGDQLTCEWQVGGGSEAHE